MAEKRKTKKKKKLFQDFDIFPIVRLVFLLFLAFFIVYLYYLHTKGILLSTAYSLWSDHQKQIEIILGITGYSAFVFYLGYRKGRKM